MEPPEDSKTAVLINNTTDELAIAAAKQLKSLEIETKDSWKPSNGSSTKPNGNNREGSSTSSTRNSRTITGQKSTQRSSSIGGNTGSTKLQLKSGHTSGCTSPEHNKKLPMNKIVVGQSPSPQVSKVTSKIGSLSNTSYKPAGGKVKIEHKKLEWKAESKIGSLNNIKHTPGGGAVKIESKKIQIRQTSSRIGSLSNVGHTPGGGSKKIFDDKEYLAQQSQTHQKSSAIRSPSSNSNFDESSGGGTSNTKNISSQE